MVTVAELESYFPHLDEPQRFVTTLEDWIETTEPGSSASTEVDAVRK